MNEISFSEIESNRFDLVIFRGRIDQINVDFFKNLISGNKIDILIVRLPGNNKSSHYKLTTLGYNCLHADSLVYYEADISNINAFSNTLEFEFINSKNSTVLKEIIPEIFKGYSNHYSSNPSLDSKKIIEGYVEWGLAKVGDLNNNIAWYAKLDGRVAGFIICSLNKITKECEVILNGVIPDSMGRGVYLDMLRYLKSYVLGLGFKRIIISTQLSNYKVQRAWIKEGFTLFNSFETYHVNSFLSNPSKAKFA